MFFTNSIRLCIKLNQRKLVSYNYTKIVLSSYKIPNQNFSSNSENTPIIEEKIYHGSLATNIKGVKVFSILTSLGGVAAQPILYEHGGKLGGTPMIIVLCSFAGFFTFITPFLLHWVTSKYVTEMYHNKLTNQYTAVTLSFFLRRKLTIFKVKDVTVPEIPGMFTSFEVGKQKLFVEPSLFSDPNHYIKIMGYDKPIDFKLELNDKKKIDQ